MPGPGRWRAERDDIALRFRPLTERDLADAPGWLGEIDLRADRWRDESTRSVVAQGEDGAILAAGIVWTSHAHDDRYWADVVVDPARRRARIGTAMFRHLSGLRARDLPFMTRGYVDDPRLAFAFALGARTIQVVPPARIELVRRTALRPLPGIAPGTEVPMSAIEDANASFYQWIHASWSPVSPEFVAAVNAGLKDDLDLASTAVAVDGQGRPRAVALVYGDTDPPVVCAETVRPDEPDGERLVEGCLRAALDALAERGLAEVEFDGHVTDPHLLPNWAKLAPSGRWFLLVEVPPAR
ncbi:N-acetyltransferase [Microbacterium kribbense]|uniref:N-acetyltransferase n=2 Tax=Microbacterium kribbense TaxID=433645 RepID=A0ABP7G4L2_9MICO